MARIDDLIDQVSDKALRQRLRNALSDIKRRQRFGLVFEEHVPETTSIPEFPVHVGATVQRRNDPEGSRLYIVRKTEGGGRVAIEPEAGGPAELAKTSELFVVKRFGDPIFPSLTSIGTVRRAAPDRPHHAVINGENFHTLQLLVYLFDGNVDCIYIDPPYNTGARDWKYNNRYVDRNDAWRHSKWLSFMEKRLKLAKRLLKRDGVLIVTIDEHEVHHLAMLLEKVFPEYLRYTITAVINPKGTYKLNFGRVEEYLLFVVPNLDQDVIVPKPSDDADAQTSELTNYQVIKKLTATLGEKALSQFEKQLEPEEIDVLHASMSDNDEGLKNSETATHEDWFLRRRGQESSYRTQRPNQFFAILVDTAAMKVIGIGPALAKNAPYKVTRKKNILTVYPVDNEGHERVWRYSRETMQRYIVAGEIVLGKFNEKNKTWTLNHRKLRKTVRRHKTVWWEKRHDAGVHGTNVVNNLLGQRGLFPFPKSVYAVQDALACVVRDRPHALIVDFFAGSGTTLHATCLLNADDGGFRRTVLVTNNEVAEAAAAQLNKENIWRGDPRFEQHGIFSKVTRPRCEATIRGVRPDGTKIPGAHVNGRPFGQGFQENVEFFRMDYLDADDVDLGNQSQAIFPLLWLAAGAKGARERLAVDSDMHIPTAGPYAILLREEKFRAFSKAIASRHDITHVWIVTDSEDSFSEMRAALRPDLVTSMLYRDYLRNFTINTRTNA